MRKTIKFYKYIVSLLVHLIFGKNIHCANGRPKFNHFSVVKCQLIAGNNVNFNGVKLLGAGRVIIGDNFHSGEELVVLTSSHNYKGTSLPYDHTLITKNVTIGDNVWAGMRVTILPGSTVGEGVIIQAGSVVHGVVPELAIIGGSPARTIRFRDAKHYEDLKREGAFA